MQRKKRSARCSTAAPHVRRNTWSKSGGTRSFRKRFFDKLRQAIFHSDAWTKLTGQHRTMLGDHFHGNTHLVYRQIILPGAGFRAEPDKCGAQHALQLWVALLGKLLANFDQRATHQLAAAHAKQIRQLRDAGRDLAARLELFRIQTAEIILQNCDRRFLVAAFQQQFDELAYIARRHTRRLMRQQHALLAGLRHFRPEHPVQDVGMRLDQHSGLAHLVFLHLQDLAQRVHLTAHVLHHLVHGVDLHFALLESFEGEANCHVLGRFHQQWRVIGALVCLRCESFQQTLKVHPRVCWGLDQFLLELRRVEIDSLRGFSKVGQ